MSVCKTNFPDFTKNSFSPTALKNFPRIFHPVLKKKFSVMHSSLLMVCVCVLLLRCSDTRTHTYIRPPKYPLCQPNGNLPLKVSFLFLFLGRTALVLSFSLFISLSSFQTLYILWWYQLIMRFFIPSFPLSLHTSLPLPSSQCLSLVCRAFDTQ